MICLKIDIKKELQGYKNLKDSLQVKLKAFDIEMNRKITHTDPKYFSKKNKHKRKYSYGSSIKGKYDLKSYGSIISVSSSTRNRWSI